MRSPSQLHYFDHLPDSQDEIQWLDRVHMRGLLANRPAASAGSLSGADGTINNGSTAFSSASGRFGSALVGSTITIEGTNYTISAAPSLTTLTLSTSYTGSNTTIGVWTITNATESNKGMYYAATDTTPNKFYQSDGASWYQIGGAVDRDLLFRVDGLGSVITTGIRGDARISFDCTIKQWTLLADQTGSIQIDIWKIDYSSYPPVAGNTITGSSTPAITSDVKNSSSTLTGWTTSISAGDCLRFNVDSVSTITRVTLALELEG